MSGWRAVIACAALGVVLLALGWSLRAHRDGGEMSAWPRTALVDIEPESGRAFRVALPASAPSDDDADGTRAVVLEDGRPFGACATHDAIREHGGGRHSFWRGTLYFSTIGGSVPRTNGKRYEAAWPSALRGALERGARWGGWTAIALGLLLALRRAFRPSRRTLARLALVPASILVGLLGAEVWLRIRYPFADNVWPGRFDPAVGFTIEPGAIVRWTNLYDYCLEQRANAFGFLDREVAPELPAGTQRIVVLGDSFVEAVQVPIADKFHVVLERRLRERGVHVATHAFGTSGSGTSNELAFYEAIASKLTPAPALVIVLFVSNDIANNSALLEAVRNGWHPDHPPRLFFRERGAAVERVGIDPDWRTHAIPIEAPAMATTWRDASRLYRWAHANFAAATGADLQPVFELYTRRLAWLRATPAWRDALAGWNWPDDADFDVMTACIDPPPAFAEAVRLTEPSLRVLRDRVAADGGRLVVVASHNVGELIPEPPLRRPHHPRFWIDVVTPICARLELPLLDLHADFMERGVIREVEFARDRHWNAFGHANAAAAIDAFLAAHPELLGPR